MEDRMSVVTFVNRFNAGDFDSANVSVQCKAGWWDWFCKDNSLRNRLKPMAKFLESIVYSGRFDPDKTYAFFKNNCPMVGSLYDSMSICNLDGGGVLFWIGFLKKGDHGVKYSRVEVSCANIPEDEEGSFGKSFEFKNKAETSKWFAGMDYETIKADRLRREEKEKEKAQVERQKIHTKKRFVLLSRKEILEKELENLNKAVEELDSQYSDVLVK